jgi:hypothetical protein
MKESIIRLIHYRIQQSQESLLEAQALFQSSLLRGAINRAYYAMFYMVMALAVLRQEATSKHSGAIAFFDKEFVKRGIFPRALSQSLHLAFQRRQENDYGEIFACTQEDANQAIMDATEFVSVVNQYISKTLDT